MASPAPPPPSASSGALRCLSTAACSSAAAHREPPTRVHTAIASSSAWLQSSGEYTCRSGVSIRKDAPLTICCMRLSGALCTTCDTRLHGVSKDGRRLTG